MLNLDPRALFIFRAFFAVVLLTNFLVRLQDFELIYLSSGLFEGDQKSKLFSFHSLSGSAFYQGSLFVIGIILCFANASGWKSQLISFFLYFFCVSIYNNTQIIGNGGDKLTCLILFLSFLLPQSNYRIYFSRPFLRRNTDKELPHHEFATLAVLLQLFSLYFFSGFIKGGSWLTGQAIENALTSEKYSF